jgi:hypothetical protein
MVDNFEYEPNWKPHPSAFNPPVSMKTPALIIVSAFVVALLPFFSGCQHATPSVSQKAVVEKADITINFNGMPAMQVAAFYEQLTGKKITEPAGGYPNAFVQLHTEAPTTKKQAIRLIEDALKQQDHVALQHGTDGSLSAIPVSE